MLMKTVKFTGQFGCYTVGDIAEFKEKRADALVKGKVAIYVPREPETKETPCKAKSQAKSTSSTDTLSAKA